jgi:hypothetical protein
VSGFWSFTVVTGTDFNVVLTWQDATGSPINLTGYSAKMEIRDWPGGVLHSTLSTGNGQIVLGGSAGTIQLLIPAAQTSAFTWSMPAWYDLMMTTAAPATSCLLYGRVTLQYAVTV